MNPKTYGLRPQLWLLPRLNNAGSAAREMDQGIDKLGIRKWKWASGIGQRATGCRDQKIVLRDISLSLCLNITCTVRVIAEL